MMMSQQLLTLSDVTVIVEHVQYIRGVTRASINRSKHDFETL